MTGDARSEALYQAAVKSLNDMIGTRTFRAAAPTALTYDGLMAAMKSLQQPKQPILRRIEVLDDGHFVAELVFLDQNGHEMSPRRILLRSELLKTLRSIERPVTGTPFFGVPVIWR